MIKTFKYRLCPNRKQRVILASTLESCRELYNMLLEQRRYQRISRFSQISQLTKLRNAFPEYQKIASKVVEDVATRVDRSFQHLFRGAGFPRFKGKDRYDSFTFRKSFKLSGNYVQLYKIGNIGLRLSRSVPTDSAIKNCIIHRRGGNWYACFVVEYKTPEPLPTNAQSIGIDVGVEHMAALSDGTFIPNPRFYEKAQAKLRRCQRRVSRRHRGSERRRKAVAALFKVHQEIGDRRNDFLHKRTRELVNRYGFIAVETLNVGGLAGGMLAKQVHDVSWGQFFRQLAYKAAEAGRELVAVNCRGTSQECPACGNKKKKALSERTHKCAECGLVMHRDTAAAQVILGRAGLSGANEGASSPCVA